MSRWSRWRARRASLAGLYDVRSLLMLLATGWAVLFHIAQRPPLWSQVVVVPWALGVVALGGLAKARPERHWYVALVAAVLTLEAWAGWPWAVLATWATRVAGWRLRGKEVAGITAAACLLALAHRADPSVVVVMGAFVLLPGLFAAQSRRTADLIEELRETRRELARLAVVEERNRIARDLHDLVGHSLSVVAVKTELTRRLVAVDPGRAETELADIDAVVRRALAEVRQAVTNYKQPTLAAEISGAVSATRSVDIPCAVTMPDTWDLPVPVEGLLAWTVREGITNVLRHSRARTCSITLTLDERSAGVEIRDDGAAPADPGEPNGSEGPGGSDGPGRSGGGNGLVGLSERAAALGGTITAGERPEGGGFRLHVRVPLT
ncbi:sensor histidine kinase [Nonomuraea rhodomycinica]|uniref:Sensor histidine kinase n=1 Tax=Nonomuraea rhodomycinica TaxID=1712872 RepID=A0A7Y6MES9_9ACTN|nr:histidine kinase [Nonomuraea rhodomycinica]NUW44044.1 sensor histidine kinase [Nonomuraea rhodomycinica]